jgi:hypothetical protein
MLQQWTTIDYKIWTPQQTKAAEPLTAVCLKQHKFPQYADIQCCVLKGERNRVICDTEGERNIAYFQRVDNEYGACNEIKKSHDTVVAILVGS